MLSGGKTQGVGVGLLPLARRRLGLENDMVWSGVSMTVEKHVARLVAAVLVVTVVLVVGATGDVMAAPPNITIDHPLTGSSTANQTPPFSGTTDDILDPVTLYIYAGVGAGGSPVQTLTAIALLELTPLEGTWAAEPESALEPGQYTAVAEQTNVEPPAGQSAPVTFTVDTSPPSVSIASVPSPTNDSTPTLTGGAGTAAGDDPTVAVAIYEGGSTSGSPVRTVGGTVSGSTWTAGPIVSLPDGTYTAQASQGDEAGNTGKSATVTFTVDTTPPAVSLGSVSSPTNDSTPMLTGGTGTATGDDPAVTVMIYEGGSTSGSPVRTVGGAVSGSTWTAGPVATLPDGVYTAQASQGDEAGNTGKSGAVAFTVDRTPPTVTINSVPSPTHDRTPMLAGGGGTAVGDESTVTVTIYEGGSVAGAIATSKSVPVSGGGWSYTAPKLNDGTYTARVSQSDVAGNTGTSVAVTFTVDTVAPVVSLGSVPSPTKDSTPMLTGGAGTAAGDDATVTVTIYQGGSVAGAIATSKSVSVSGGGWSYTAPKLDDGTYTARVSQSDVAGNTGTSVAVTFRVDTSPPVVAVTVPAAGAALNSSNPTVSGLAGQASGDDPLVTLKLYAGSTVSGSPIQTDKVTPSGANWTTGAISALADGTYTALAEQSDEAGNTGKSAAVTFAIDTTLPAVTLTSPADKGSTSAEFESFSGAAGSAAGDLPQVTVKLFVGSTIANEALKEVTVPAVNGHWAAAFGGLSSGTYTAQAQQSDDLGRSGLSEPVTFTVNIPVPGPPPVTPPVVSAPSAQTTPSPPVASFHWFPSAPHTGEAISLVSTSTDASSPITGFAWSLSGNGAFGAGAPTLTTSFSTPGAHVVLLQVTDANGLSSIVAETIPVTSPAPTLMQPFPVVRIAGSENASGVRVGLLTVQAPVGATVNVSCRGPGCRARFQNVVATSGRSKSKGGMVLIVFRRFEHPLRAGAALEIRVSKPGQIGKYTRFAVRHAKLPARVDTCLSPAGIKPIVCPSS